MAESPAPTQEFETPPQRPGRLSGRVAMITGASRGIGAAVARRFSAEGAHVILVARTQGALEELDDDIRAAGGTATLSPADLTQYDIIDQMAGAIYQRYGKLDVLVGNAAMLGTPGPVGHWKPETFEQVMAVNLTANWRLIRAFDPLLRRSDAGRAVFVTSAVGRHPRPFFGAYGASKAALDTLVKTYAAEIKNTPVRVNLIDPGRTRTKMRAEAYPGEDPNSVKTPETLTDLFLDLAVPENQRHGEVVEAGNG